MLISSTINDALIEIGVISPIDEASSQDHAYGLRKLNRIIDSYNTQNLIITYLEDIIMPSPTAWKNSNTIGPGEDIDTTSPIEVQAAFFRQGTTDYNLTVMTFNEWASIPDKTTVQIPSKYYIQNTNDNGSKIYFDTIPQSDLSLHLLAKMPYTGKNSVGNDYLPTDDINWTFGFEKMLMLRLAIELAPSYEIQPSQILVGLAQEAEDNVKTRNYQPKTLMTSTSLRGTYRNFRRR